MEACVLRGVVYGGLCVARGVVPGACVLRRVLYGLYVLRGVVGMRPLCCAVR